MIPVRQNTKAGGGINTRPLWARIVILFLIIVGGTIVYKYFDAGHERSQDLKVERIACEGEALGGSGAGDAAYIKVLTSADMVGAWDDEDIVLELRPSRLS